MSWRQVGWTVLFSPVLIGLLPFIAALIVWKLPRACCERLRAVRYLPLAGLCYYTAIVAALSLALGLTWWEILLLSGLAVVGGEWLLPDPMSFVFSPARRRAVVRAVEFVEQQGGLRALYGMVAVIGSEAGRQVVSVSVMSGWIPPGRRFVAVAPDGTVEELEYEHVAAAHGVRPRF
ncbi:hypothetical protein [Fimbriiglobus ruber]|uniref:hypothetical protein n=1 Tax=Fimbriiglobus ruber TaxID=1908690 RepID=UPI00117B3013|nr:hypothetical protein [Fimbriiglobus ruber]